ncbi:hypothetical protein O6H91_08G079100 [Diphasiastrum complanatum]|uniref:Uncharacterized protein n=1 Tax=Diphasiastrum complanatum TaxID=34168 RepID=A0ACC2CZF6_DIPCM|nr:hypothetical protein O6H91_08G079100 [Diphasiastrum complanatum]
MILRYCLRRKGCEGLGTARWRLPLCATLPLFAAPAALIALPLPATPRCLTCNLPAVARCLINCLLQPNASAGPAIYPLPLRSMCSLEACQHACIFQSRVRPPTIAICLCSLCNSSLPVRGCPPVYLLVLVAYSLSYCRFTPAYWICDLL